MDKPTDHHIVVYSGGMDSFTLLHHVRQLYIKNPFALERQRKLSTISFDYGQRHRRELQSVEKVTGDLGIQHRVIDLSLLRSTMQGSALTDNSIEVPEGHYEAESMKATVVPGRNTVMLAVALAHAEGSLAPGETATIYYGAHAGDHHIYPDCRPAYITAMQSAIGLATDNRVKLAAPFQYVSKTEILRQGLTSLQLSALAYADTWTCYKGESEPCGKCGACQERAEAFLICNAIDPLVPVTA